jgi:L,D-transpeptidase-like protein/sporulation and spore germination protein/putative peptidoglycan binding protein
MIALHGICAARREGTVAAIANREHVMRRVAILAAAAFVAAAVFASVAGSAPSRREVQVAVVKGGGVVLVTRVVPPSFVPVKHAVRELLEGPTKDERAAGLRTAFAPGTTLRSLRLDGDRYVASFSARLLAPAAPRTMATRIAQLVATVSRFSAATHLDIAVNGRLVDVVPLEPRPPWWRPAQPPPTGTVRPDAYPFSIRGVQLRLASLGFMDPADAAGELDYRTSQALLAFQGWEDIGRTGNVDDTTQVALTQAGRPRPSDRAPGRRIEIHRAAGVLLLLEGNEVVRAVHTSTGAFGRTPSGTFRIYRKETLSWSNLFHVWMPFASYFRGGIAMHEYPDVPSYPASHGCVRLPAGEAVRVFGFATLGTPVYVV